MKKLAFTVTALLIIFLFGCGKELPEISDAEKTVNLTVNCLTAVEYGRSGLPEDGLILNESITVPGDSSVFDVLKQALEDNDLTLDARGDYVKSIGGLGEGDCGKSSGWMYRVKGEFPNMSCGKYIPEDGDLIEFIYSVEYGDII